MPSLGEQRVVKHVNLVFQGGGVRGAAYVGALETLPASVRIHMVAGASAGSIVAGLLAIGKTPAEIAEIMRRTPFQSLLDDDERRRAKRLWALIAPEADDRKGLARLAWVAGRVFSSVISIVRDVRYVSKNMGMHRSDKLKEWLDEIFEGKRFKDIKTDELLIVASDVSGRAFQYFSSKHDPEMSIAFAVLASASIPIFFQPVETDGKILVDGGVLSNFPAHLFAKSIYPTIGLRLRQTSRRRAPIQSFPSLIGGLIGTMTDAHDKIRIPQAHFHEYAIDTGSASSFDFEMSAEATERLIDAGRACGKQIPWETTATDSPVYKFDDSRPYDLLSRSLSEMRVVLEAAESVQMWCDELEEEIVFDYFFERDWGSRFEFEYRFTVGGSIPLIVRRFGLIDGPPEPGSMVNSYPTITPLDPNSAFTVHAVPWCASNAHKGFCLFMVPAITEKSGLQGFRLSVDISQDHLVALRMKGEDNFPWKFRRRAHRHHLVATVRFWVDRSLDSISVEPREAVWTRVPNQVPTGSSQAYAPSGQYTFRGDLAMDYAAQFVFTRGR